MPTSCECMQRSLCLASYPPLVAPEYCKLCGATPCRLVPGPDARTFLACQGCGLVFVPSKDWLSVERERERYDFHHNEPDHAGYVAFLSEVVEAVLALDLDRQRSRVLDFGCGKKAVLAQLLREHGYSVTAYDPLYCGLDSIEASYDLVVLCEVIEHLRDLGGELDRIARVLAANGRMLVRTQLVPESRAMASWWYARDPTHINFFTLPAMEVVGRRIARPAVRMLGPDLFVCDADPKLS